jgi:hypothetical protein
MALGLLACLAVQAAAQNVVEEPRLSTHDWTSTPGSSPSLNEWWADVKTPGDGFRYSYGSCVASNTFGAEFSLFPVDLPNLGGLELFAFPPGRQVTILQCATDAGIIVWQRYFYGSTPGFGQKGNGLSTNARGISVFPAAAAVDTRIAICGETYDEDIENAQADNPNAGPQNPAGFIAVLNGNGVLLWSRLFTGRSENGECAVTDVSIRIEFNAAGQPVNDVVTYCGISSHGVELDAQGVPTAANGALTPINWFPAPFSVPGVHDPAPGNADNGVDQWDGFVGRITNGHLAAQPPVAAVFHAVVGGREQDGLFGLAEIDGDRFVAVGSSAVAALGSPGTLSFPFTSSSLFVSWLQTQYCVGAQCRFNAAGGALQLEAADSIGTPGEGRHTFARDVFVHRDATLAGVVMGSSVPVSATIHVVGSTDDPALFSLGSLPLTTAVGQTTIGGLVDGFLLSSRDALGINVFLADVGTYHGGPFNDGLMGVSGWNESRDHISVFGFTEGFDLLAPVLQDLEIASYFFDSGSALGDIANPERLIRDNFPSPAFPGGGVETPNAMGAIRATNGGSGLDFFEFGLASPQGGGISVDARGRTEGVGSVDSAGYPVLGVGSRTYLGSIDAIRTGFDIVPVGVGRTDETGFNLGFVPPAPANGGTTPVCALAPFGRQIGLPNPVLDRTFINWQGPLQGGSTTSAVLIDRLPGSVLIGAVLQFGLPSNPPIPFLGAELWCTNSTALLLTLPPQNGTFRVGLAALPPAPFDASAQLLVLTAAPFACNGFDLVATPALYFSY